MDDRIRSPVTRVDDVMVGRTAGSLEPFVGAILTHAALEALGDRFHIIGVSDPSLRRLWMQKRGLISFRAIDKGET